MNVAIDAMLLRPPYTGVQRYIAGLIEAVVSHVPEINLTVYLGRGHGRQMPEARTIRVRESLVGKNRLARICWEQIVLPFKLRFGDADLLHAPCYVMPALTSVIPRIPTVLTVHDVTALDRPHLVSALNAFHYGLVMPVSLRLARCVIVPTRAVADRIVENGLSASRVEVVPWGIDDRFFDPGNPDPAVLAELGVTRPYVLNVGRIEPKKNIEQVVKAFFAMKMDTSLPHQLVLAGTRGPSHKSVSRLVHDLNMESSVVFAGQVSDDALAGLYKQADLVVCASTEEGFGFTPLEALACGTAVITSDIPAFTELLGRDAPMVDPSDLPGLRGKMTEMLRDESARSEAAEAGKKKASRYTWERCARRTYEIYQECTGVRS